MKFKIVGPGTKKDVKIYFKKSMWCKLRQVLYSKQCTELSENTPDSDSLDKSVKIF